MEFKKAKTVEEFKKVIPLMHQFASSTEEKIDDQDLCDRFELAVKEGNYHHFYGTIDDKIISSVGMTKCYNPTFPTPGYWITNLIVDKDYRGQGFGRKTIGACKNIALEDNSEWLWLSADKEDYYNLNFYKKHGFKHSTNYMYCILEKGNNQ